MSNSLPLPHRQGPPLLSAHGLTKTYGSTRALDGVDLSISPGESVAIMGPPARARPP